MGCPGMQEDDLKARGHDFDSSVCFEIFTVPLWNSTWVGAVLHSLRNEKLKQVGGCGGQESHGARWLKGTQKGEPEGIEAKGFRWVPLV